MAQPIKPTPQYRELVTQPIAPPPAAVLEKAPPPGADTANDFPAVEHDLEACAKAVIETLPKHIAEHIREVAYIYNRQPLWSLVAGHCLKAYEAGDIAAPIQDPSWPRQFKDLGVDPGVRVYTCVACSKPFEPKRYKQQACSTECGQALADKSIAEWNEKNAKKMKVL